MSINRSPLFFANSRPSAQRKPYVMEDQILPFITTSREDFETIKQFFTDLGLTFTWNDAKHELTLPATDADQAKYLKELARKTYNIIAFNVQLDQSSTVHSACMKRFRALDVKSIPRLVKFQSQLPSCDIEAHEAFIPDFSIMHTEMLKSLPVGTYAILQNDACYTLVLNGMQDGIKKSFGAEFMLNKDGKISLNRHLYDSINHVTHDNQYYLCTDHIQHPLVMPFAKLIAGSPELSAQLTKFKQNKDLPVVTDSIKFLINLRDTKRMKCEEKELIAVAIHELQLKPESVLQLLAGLVRTLPLARSGSIGLTLNTTSSGNSFMYFRKIANEDMNTHANVYGNIAQATTEEINKLWDELLEMYEGRENIPYTRYC